MTTLTNAECVEKKYQEYVKYHRMGGKSFAQWIETQIVEEKDESPKQNVR